MTLREAEQALGSILTTEGHNLTGNQAVAIAVAVETLKYPERMGCACCTHYQSINISGDGWCQRRKALRSGHTWACDDYEGANWGG